MRRRKARLIRISGGASFAAELFDRMEERGAIRHARAAAKEWLLASRSMLDGLIDVLDDEAEAGRDVPAGDGEPSGNRGSRKPAASEMAKGARKIEIAEE